jgi:uncharacterized DUF497 family protein
MKPQPVIWRAPNGVEFEWDPAKAQANLRKHRIPFPVACEVFKDSNRFERLDDSSGHEEERWIAIGCVDETILFVVFTERGGRVRLISARRATRNERRTY